MRAITELEELKKIELDILRSVHSFCQENGINYSLAYGTLLGAVRHQGFIPWDDDIDIMMLRVDYERFLQSFKHPYYQVYECNHTSSSNRLNKEKYYLPFAKVADTRTILKEKVRYETIYGVYIDIFPVDDMPNAGCGFKSFFFGKRVINSISTLKIVRIGHRSFVKNLLLFCANVLFSPISISWLGRMTNKYAQKYNNQGHVRSAVFVPYDNKPKWVVDKDIFNHTRLLQFESDRFYCPDRYDEYLTALYGDWRQLPPVEKRVTHHSFDAWWKE